MTKRWALKGMNCANCAAKIEHRISRLKDVAEVSVDIFSQRLMIDFNAGTSEESIESVSREALALLSRLEPQAEATELGRVQDA